MANIYQQTVEAVEQGSRFHVDFQKRSLRINGKYLIKEGAYEGDLGVDIPNNPLLEIEKLFIRYHHSIPSERSENRRKRYFRALPEHELSDDDMLYGIHREVAQIELELYILIAIIQNKIQWDEFAKDKWFWQSPTYPSLIILKQWIVNTTSNK